MTEGKKRHYVERVLKTALKQKVSTVAKKYNAEAPALSIISIVSSLRTLARRSRQLGTFRTIPIDFFSWQRPSYTLTGLVIYTAFCIWPHLIAAAPLVLMLGFVIIPHYAEKYMVDEIPNIQVQPEVEDSIEEIETGEPKEERELNVMLRRIQASLGNLVEMCDRFEDYRKNFGNFSDPAESSALFIFLLVVLVLALIVARYIPMSPLFVVCGWGFVGLMHPGIKLHLDDFMSDLDEIEEKVREWSITGVIYEILKKQFDYSDEPVMRLVEAFEIQKQGVTARFWEPLLFSPIAAATDPVVGVKFLGDVLPPENWYFDPDEPWCLDSDTKQWVEGRGLDQYSVLGGWALDSTEQFRRRRYYRRAYYSR